MVFASAAQCCDCSWFCFHSGFCFILLSLMQNSVEMQFIACVRKSHAAFFSISLRNAISCQLKDRELEIEAIKTSLCMQLSCLQNQKWQKSTYLSQSISSQTLPWGFGGFHSAGVGVIKRSSKSNIFLSKIDSSSAELGLTDDSFAVLSGRALHWLLTRSAVIWKFVDYHIGDADLCTQCLKKRLLILC